MWHLAQGFVRLRCADMTLASVSSSREKQGQQAYQDDPNGKLSSQPRSCWTLLLTLAWRERPSCLLMEHPGLLREAFGSVRHDRPFPIDAIIVLPDPLPATGQCRQVMMMFQDLACGKKRVHPSARQNGPWHFSQRQGGIPFMATRVVGTYSHR